MDEYRGIEYPFAIELPMGRIWPWVILASGVLIVVIGAMFFTAA